MIIRMRNIPPLAAVRVFEAAARHENFTIAAAELGLTQAAVSYQIKLLEERLGVQLFLRSKRRVFLSEAGRLVASQVSRAFDTLSEAFSRVIADDDGVLTISTTPTFASNWLALRLGSFAVARPELAVRLHADSTLVDFAKDDVDVAIRHGHGPWPNLRQHFLFHVHSVPMCSPEFKERHAIRKHRDLLDVPRLNPDYEWWREWFDMVGIASDEEARGHGLRVDLQLAEGNAAMSGHGVAMLSPMLWERELALGQLVQLFPEIALERPSYLVYPEHKRHKTKIRAFRDWIIGEFAELAKRGPPEIFTPPPPLH